MSSYLSSSSSSLAAKFPRQTTTNWPSIYVSTLVAFIGAIHQSSVMVWPYLQLIDSSANETFYGFLRSISGLGTILTAILAGYLTNRTANTRGSMIIGKVLALLSCTLYLCIELAPPSTTRVHLLFIMFELFLGASVGAANMYRTHVAHASTEADRAKAVGVVSLAPSVGMIIGPVITLVFSSIAFPGWRLPIGIHLNLFTAPILLAICVSTIALYLLLFYFDGTIRLRNDNTADNSAQNGAVVVRPHHNYQRIHNHHQQQLQQQYPAVLVTPSPAFDWIAVSVCLFTRATVSFSLLNLITVGPPYIQMIFRWTSTQMVRYQSYILGAIGLHGIGWNLAYVFLDIRKRLSERNAIIMSLGLLLFAYLVTFNWPFLDKTIPYQQPQQLSLVNVSNSSSSALSPFSAPVEAPLGCPLRFDWCGTTTLVSMPIFLGSLVLALGVAIPVSQINLDIFYSKVLGNIRQGTMQGWFIVCSDGLAVVLPMALGTIYEWHGPVPIWLAIIMCIIVSLSLCVILYHHLSVSNGHNKMLTECHQLEMRVTEKGIKNR